MCPFNLHPNFKRSKSLSNKNQGQPEPKMSIQHKLLMKNINLRSLTYAHFSEHVYQQKYNAFCLEFYSRAHALNTLTPY